MASTAKKPAVQFRNAEGPFSSPEKRKVVLCLLLALLTLAVYNPVSHHPFVNYDDNLYITQNPQVRAGLSWASARWAFTTFEQANWHPLSWISHQLDYELFRLNPAGHHYSNVLLHGLNAMLLFLVLQWATGMTWRSLMVATLFAVHPVNVESVAWVAERKTLLSMVFFLLALAAYGHYARKPGVGRYAAVLGLFALGLMSKPMVITLPCMLLLWDYWPLRRMGSPQPEMPSGVKGRSLAWLIAEKLPLFALSAASAVVTMRAQAQGGAVRSMSEFSLAGRLENALVAYGRYLVRAMWPVQLSPMYPHWNALPVWQIGLAAVFLGAITVLVVRSRKHPYLLVGWFWFLGTLVPMIGVVQVGEQAMADRYAYLPYVGLFLMVCWGAGEWAKERGVEARWLTATAAIVLVALVALTARQIGYWQDNITLWRHALQVTGDNFVAEDNLGGALVDEGRSEEAIAHFQRAQAINPADPMSRLNIAAYEQQHGRLQEAIAGDEAVLRMTSDRGLQATAYSNLGSAYRKVHDYTRARAMYEAALKMAPTNAQAWMGLGLVEEKRGEMSQAAEDFRRATEIAPSDVEYLLLGQALEKAGHASEAQAAEEEAQRLSADLPQAERSVYRLLSE